MAMTPEEHIRSIEHLLHQFNTEDCGYAEFAACMAESVPFLQQHTARLGVVVDAQRAVIEAYAERDASKLDYEQSVHALETFRRRGGKFNYDTTRSPHDDMCDEAKLRAEKAIWSLPIARARLSEIEGESK